MEGLVAFWNFALGFIVVNLVWIIGFLLVLVIAISLFMFIVPLFTKEDRPYRAIKESHGDETIGQP